MPICFNYRLVALSFLLGVLALADHAWACTIKSSPDTFVINQAVAATGPMAPQSTKVQVRRSKYAGPGKGDCGDVGSIQLDFELAGTTWPDTMGIRLRVLNGDLPRRMILPDVPLKVTNGSLSFAFSDDPAQPMDVTLQATTVDSTGNESSPISIHVVSAGNRSEGGCSFSSLSQTTSGFAIFFLGLIFFASVKIRLYLMNHQPV